jgi:ketosteroid isomerase-like protein
MLRLLGISMVSMLMFATPASGIACESTPELALKQFIAAFNALDWPAFQACFAESASLFNPDVPGATSLHRLDGREAVERSFRGVFDAAAAGSAPPHGPNIVPEHLKIQQFGAAAVLSFEFRRAAGSFGRRTIVMAKQADGWHIVHIHASNVTHADS